MVANRKARKLRNLGGTFEETVEPFFDGPPLAETRTSIVLVERFLLAVLRSEIDRLKPKANQSELERFFSHIFDPTMGKEERAAFVTNFQTTPPNVVLGYPRTTAELPIFAVVLTSDEEAEPSALGKYVGETLEGEDAPGREDAEYEGAFFEQKYSIYIYAQHPDVLNYLYHFGKLILFGAREAMEAAGIIDPKYSGGELSPDEVHLPDNVYARVLNVTAKSLMTIPRLFPMHKDGRRLRVTGIFREDIVVDGVRGGVKTFVPGEENDG